MEALLALILEVPWQAETVTWRHKPLTNEGYVSPS